MPKVSVLITNYNYKRYLSARIRSVQKQLFRDLEIIFLDDASTDGSIGAAEKLLLKSSVPYSLFQAESNSGSALGNWKKGLEMSSGEYIWIAEADDTARSDFLKQLVPILDQDPELGLVYCESAVIDEKDRLVSETFYRDIHARISSIKWDRNYTNDGQAEIREVLSIMNTIPNVSSVVFRRKALKDALKSPDNFSLSGDWITYIRILENYRIGQPVF